MDNIKYLKQNRDFKGVWIPKEIWFNTELSLLDKIIFTEIDSLDNENHCTAGNEYFSEFIGCSTSAVSKSISKLTEMDYVSLVNFDGRHRTLKSNLKYMIVKGEK